MKYLIYAFLIGMLANASASSASAQIFFKQKPRVNPSQRVPELILTLKIEKDERKRASAAEELREYDAAIFTEIVPVLADTLLADKKQSVRLEALASLVRIRPVNPIAGQAMEKAAADDESFRVRFQARTALAKYHLAGYTTKRPEAVNVNRPTTSEPPLSVAPGPISNVPRVETPLPTTPPQPARVVTTPGAPRPLPIAVTAPKTTAEPPVQGPSLFP